MIKINQHVVYGSNGICKVVDKREECFGGEPKMYYVLSPVSDEQTTLYLPADSPDAELRVKNVLSVDEVQSLIQSMPTEETMWIEDDRTRGERYRDIVSKGNRAELVRVTKTLYEHQQTLSQSGKKLRVADKNVLQQAEKILFDEFAVVLGIESGDVAEFIAAQLADETPEP